VTLVQLAFCVSALTELEIIGISSSFKAETRLSWKSGGDFQREFRSERVTRASALLFFRY